MSSSKQLCAAKLKPTLRSRVSRPYRPDLIPAVPLCIGPKTSRAPSWRSLFLGHERQALSDVHPASTFSIAGAVILAPVVRKGTLERLPEIKTPLEKLSAQLDNETMAATVDLQGRLVEDVASSFLRGRVLLSGP
jgi:hypothetical protein